MEKASWETLYQAYYFELAAQALKGRWQAFDTLTSLVVMVSAVGATAFGYAMLQFPVWIKFWGLFAGAAAFVSLFHLVSGVPRKIMELEDLRSVYSKLRVDVETFRQNWNMGVQANGASSQYNELRNKLSVLAEQKRYDAYLLSKKLQQSIKRQVLENIGPIPDAGT